MSLMRIVIEIILKIYRLNLNDMKKTLEIIKMVLTALAALCGSIVGNL